MSPPISASLNSRPPTRLDTYGREYGRVSVVRVAGELAYRIEFRGEHIGYEGTLRAAVEHVHSVFIRAHTPGGAGAAAYTIHTPSVPPANRRDP